MRRDVLGKLDRQQLVEWIAFLQLDPLAEDKADQRATWHTAHLMNVATTDEFEIDEEVMESLSPTYWGGEQDAPPTSITDHAQDLQQTILTHFLR